ncbi:MAG: pyruvate dehydrogenase (acetyl-transferring) E1 component subunit alpha [Oligoflexales bacterium]
MDLDKLKNLYQQMLFCRRFEERVLTAYTSQKFSGFCHLHIGQEAVCVGIQANLQESDHMISGYRSHTQAIMKGLSAKEVFAELLGREAGCSRGKGGSMHMFSKEKRFYGGHGIVGGQAPIAAGVGFEIRYNDKNEVMVCYLGDAAMNQGQVYEAMNMAATWDLPVLYVIENNQYGMGTDIRRTTSIDHLSKRALGFDMANSRVDGMNVLKMIEHTAPIIDQMRKDHKPYLLEAITYRYKGHSVSDPASYRTKEELTAWQDLDPLSQLAKELKKQGCLEDELTDFDKNIRAEVRDIEAQAEACSFSDPAETWMHVLAP